MTLPRSATKLSGLAIAAAIVLGGCVFQDVREQQAKIGSFCTIEGLCSLACISRIAS